MLDATGNPQSILLLGGTSEIGLAIIAEYLAHAPARVVLGVQPGDPLTDATVADLLAKGARDVVALDFDATDFDSHPGVIEAAWADADVDVSRVQALLTAAGEIIEPVTEGERGTRWCDAIARRGTHSCRWAIDAAWF